MTHSILVIGVGGQGVITLGKILAIAGKLGGFEVTGCENKGGAQRGGKASSLIRLYDSRKNTCPSTRISKGSLDTVLSLELIETARNSNLYSDHTTIVSNDHIITPPLARTEGIKSIDSDKIKNAFDDCQGHLMRHDFTGLSMSMYGHTKNTNMALLSWVLHKNLLPIKKQILMDSVSLVRGKESYQTIENIIEQF